MQLSLVRTLAGVAVEVGCHEDSGSSNKELCKGNTVRFAEKSK